MTENNNQQPTEEPATPETPQRRTPVAQWWDAQQNGSTPTRPRGPMEDHTPDPHQDAKRTESSALTAMVLALVSLVFAPLAVPALILTHWAARGSQRTVALVVGWLVVVGMVATVIAVIAIGAAASNSYDNYVNSPYHQCMSDPTTSAQDCEGLSTSG